MFGKLLGLTFFVFLLFASICTKAQTPDVKKSSKTQTIDGKKYYIHTVEKSQTIYSISNVYGITKNDLIMENPELISGIKEGQDLKIPYQEKSKAINTNSGIEQQLTTPGAFTEHKVEPKQTLYAISKLYNVSIDEIVKANPEVENGLKTGQTLKIPRKITVPTYQKPEKKSEEAKSEIKAEIKPEIKQNFEHAAQQLNQVPTITDTLRPDHSRTIKVAVLLPFYLSMQKYDSDSTSSGSDIYFKSLLAIEFYQGLKMAIDSMSSKGFSFDVYTYDVGTDSLELATILAKPEMTKMDLMIGPLYNERLQQATLFSKKNSIPLVSPFSQINKVLLGNAYASKVVASQHTQMEVVCNYVKQNKSNEKIYLITDENTKESSLVNIIKKNFVGYKDSLKVISIKKGFGDIEKILNDGKAKVLITPVNDQPKITELVTKLYLSKDSSITLIGTDAWFNFSNVETERLAKTNTILPNYYLSDFSNINLINMAKIYFGKYGVEPGKYAIQGFDVGMYYLNIAAKGKAAFLNLQNYPAQGLQNNFNFYKTADESGFENKHVFLLSLKDIAPQKIN